jgi:hypothetical protein
MLMTPTSDRDQVARIAKTDTAKAVVIAEKITDPWFQAQAWSHIARYAAKPLQFSRRAAKSAAKGKDAYQQMAVRAWEIAALAERDCGMQARLALTEAVELAQTIEPLSSRAEALLLLFQAAFKISIADAGSVGEIILDSLSSDNWRAKRARKYVKLMLGGKMPPREFFW